MKSSVNLSLVPFLPLASPCVKAVGRPWPDHRTQATGRERLQSSSGQLVSCRAYAFSRWGYISRHSYRKEACHAAVAAPGAA
jgi:hypothetical protein